MEFLLLFFDRAFEIMNFSISRIAITARNSVTQYFQLGHLNSITGAKLPAQSLLGSSHSLSQPHPPLRKLKECGRRRRSQCDLECFCEGIC